MTDVMHRRFGNHVPDILDCLAQLSNDEVPTPPKVARTMLDLLPAEVWSSPDYKWLDPFSKSGVFLREVASRLLTGLTEWEPDFEKRREHIYRNMLHGNAITTMTGMIARRSLYYSRDASSDLSVIRFEGPDGNLPFTPAEHNFVRGRCSICGAPESLQRSDRENHAYAFIHGTYPTKELETMRWDVLVGNPPFQFADGGGGGGASATPIYNLFVERAFSLNPRHVVMITPSRWFSGGKGLDEFRDRMLKDRRFVTLVDHPQLYDCFPGVKIRGGVSYWHWDREHDGPCLVATKIGDHPVGKQVKRYLDAYDVLVRRNEAVSILDKVAGYRIDGLPEPGLGDTVSARKPFGLTNEKGKATTNGLSDPVLVYGNQVQSYLERAQIASNTEWIDQWKVLIVKAHGTSGREDLTILGEPVVAAPGSACTETYLVIGRTDNETEARRLAAYMRTRFVRFLVSLRKITQNITRDSYRFVPALPMDREWTGDALYARYQLTEADIDFIESTIKERPSDEVADDYDESTAEDEGLTTTAEATLPPEEVETVGSGSVARRIYAYTLPGKDAQSWERTVGGTRVSGTGLIKVGDTTKADVMQRIKQQLGTAYPHLEGVTLLLDTEAQRNDGSAFRDHDVHRALVAKGIRKDAEWFEATVDEVQAAIVAVRNGQSYDGTRTADFGMRPEQEEAVAATAGYYRSHAEDAHAPRFLWNAKMRFGKTFTTYQLAREMGWKRVLVLTYKPVVQTAWKEDLLTHVDFEGWRFVDRESSPEDRDAAADAADPVVWFASFQDMRGRTADGNIKQHNEVIHLIDWDAIVLDEYHFGAWRDSARELYDPTESEIAEAEEPDESVTEDDLGLTSRHYLYLSGTPFRAITNGEFTEDQIFNWTYVDEQREKEHWDDAVGPNPYIDLPGMQIFSYDIGGDAEKWAADGEFDGFSLNEYFKAKKLNPRSNSTAVGSYEFEDADRVYEFLEMLRGTLPEQMKLQIVGGQKPPFPYQAPVFAQAITHSVWYLNDVAACFAMRDALLKHPYFKTFEIVVAAGSGVGMGAAAKPPVMDAIDRAAKAGTGSITLTCGKLMTGVTVREWGAILMLRSLKSPETYFQAAFRVQSPWSKRLPDGAVEVLKDPVYVFEFDPNRALTLVGEYGMRLGSLGDTTPQEAIGELLNYLPIFAFAGGMMTELDAADVLNWATTGVGATALAQRWNSPLLVNINEQTLTKLLDHPELLEALGKIEDFRNLASTAEQIVTSSKLLKKAKRESEDGKLNREQKREQSETAKRRKEIREKLQKLLAKIPVFMYVTQIREQALKDIILGVDGPLFERVTGLSVEDFKLLNQIGVFNPIHMNAAIYQFKAFEDASLEYADDPSVARTERPLGLWDRVLQPGEDIEEVLLDVEAEEAAKAAAVNGGRAKAKKKRKRKKK